MKISLSPVQYFDMAGVPLTAGRLKVFYHGSDTLAPVFTMDGQDFVEGPNPCTLDNSGEMPETLFMEAAIYDIHVEKYNDGVYEKISDFQFGFNPPTVKNDTVVNGIAGLQEANPELEFVDVVGYDGTTYAGRRTYMWDSQCTESEDGGTIIASTSVPNGRWILLSDLREMPCTYFGIEAGREANMSAFLTYQPVVGTYGIFMPPVPRFLKGNYQSEGSFSTTKVLSFDQDAKLTKALVICSGIEVAPRAGYVGDFQFLNQQYAESSWFRSVKRFWKCQARELHQSRTNYFEDIDVGNYGTTCAILQNARISGTPVTQTGSANLEFNHCNIDNYALSTNWYTVFRNSDFTDKWFNDGNWDFGTDTTHRQRVRNAENRLVVDNFADANVYVLQQAANSVSAIDLQNRPVSTITGDMAFTSIRNAVIDYAHFNHNIVLENCVVNHLYLEHNYLKLTTKNCNCIIEHCQVGDWNDNRSSFALNCDVDTTFAKINWMETGIDMQTHRIGRTTDDLIYQNTPVFWRCTINNGVIASSSPIFLECNIANTPVYVYPCAIIENLQQSWTMSMEFRDNRFNGSSCILMGANNGYTDHLTEVFECAMTGLAICDNVFNTTVMGVQCPFWSGPGLAFRFIRGLTTHDPAILDRNVDLFPIVFKYKNNSGNCPREYAPAQNQDLGGSYAIANGWSTDGGGLLVEKDTIASYVFALPALANPNKEAIPDTTISNNAYDVDTRCVCTAYRMKAITAGVDDKSGSCFDFPYAAYIPACAIDKSLPNDMFYVWIAAFGPLAQFIGINPQPCGE